MMTRKLFRMVPPAEWRLWPAVLVTAALSCAMMTFIWWQSIINFVFMDPDDALRYVEVKDFISGQSWSDVSQHRINPPAGGPMHWSRLVDLPIAAMILLLRPLVGALAADTIALAVMPLILTCALCSVFGLAVRRLAGTLPAIVATGLIGLSMPILIQFHPMRIDHHSWQILMSAVALWALFDENKLRGSLIVGIAVAFWTHVSSEGLPYAALFAGAFTLSFLRDKKDWNCVPAFLFTFCCASAALLFITRGLTESLQPYCDTMSPVYLLPITAATVSLPLMRRMVKSETIVQRIMILAGSAIIAAGVYLLSSGNCRAGPFANLDPIVYKYWYLRVDEGLPAWRQTLLMATIVIVPPLIGIAGTIMAIQMEHNANRRFNWLVMLFILLGAYAVSLAVMRAMSVASLMSLPGLAAALMVLIPKAQSLKTAPGRVLATFGLFGLSSLGISAIAVMLVMFLTPEPARNKIEKKNKELELCLDRTRLKGLAALSPGTIMAPIDIGPTLLAFTPHSIVASGHHRQNLGIRDVMLSFTEGSERARKIMSTHNVRYVVYCSNLSETDNYLKLSPHGFMATLEHDRPPPWLKPVPMRPGETIRVYRVTPHPTR